MKLARTLSLRKLFERQYDALNVVSVSRSAILNNFDVLESIHKVDVIPVLKANAYGHGLKEVATILKDRTFPYIAVDGYFEALEIRKVTKQPVLVMGSIGFNNIRKLKTKNIAYVGHSLESLLVLAQTKSTLTIHLEIDTGMSRQGLSAQDLGPALFLIKTHPKLRLEGVMTHFADADNPKSEAYTRKQLKAFTEALEQIQAAGFNPKYIHVSNSAGTAKNLPDYITAVRPGIALYGISPLVSSDSYAKQLKKLQPALTYTSHICQVRELKKGERISYNGIYKADSDRQIGVIPAGYYEGIPRALSNVGIFGSKGKELPIRGRVCMDHTMLDITGKKLSVGSEVTIMSTNKQDKNSIQNLAGTYGLFNYSLLTGIASTVRRVIVK